MLLYRLAKTIRATDLTGEGAKRAGGRWNHIGTPVVYTAENGALAILEVLQYADINDIYSFSMLTIEVPNNVTVQTISVSDLSVGWHQYPHLEETKEMGRIWFSQREALILRVPSAVYSNETNWLINPQHPDAEQIRIVSVRPFLFNARLFR